MRFLITETVEYTVEAANEQEAENIWLACVPEADHARERGIEFVGVTDRSIEPA